MPDTTERQIDDAKRKSATQPLVISETQEDQVSFTNDEPRRYVK
jgi:hypothetical protein